MKPFAFLRTRRWIVFRRLVLILIAIGLLYRSYGPVLLARLQRPNAQRDLVITRSEFRPDMLGDIKPGWIIGFKNESQRFTYDRIQLEATYKNSDGSVLQTDTLVVHHKLIPGEETIIGSPDFKQRPGAAEASLKVVNADAAR
jgi:hypothetical protein